MILRHIKKIGKVIMLKEKTIASKWCSYTLITRQTESSLSTTSNRVILKQKQSKKGYGSKICFFCGATKGIMTVYEKYQLCPLCYKKCSEICLTAFQIGNAVENESEGRED